MLLNKLFLCVCSAYVCYASNYFMRGENYNVDYTAENVIEERTALSRRHCIQLCQASDCKAANYDPVTYECQLLNSAVTRLLPQNGPSALYRKGPLAAGQVGMWPLNDLYKGKNLVPGKTDITLHDVTFPDMSSEWMSPPARFSGTASSYGQFNEVVDVKLSGSFAFIAAVYREETSIGPLVEWIAGSGYSVHIWIHDNQLYVNLWCGVTMVFFWHGTAMNLNQWYTLALSYDQDTKVLSWWVDGELSQKTNACSSAPGFSSVTDAYVNHRPQSTNDKIKGRITCMGLYDTTMSYEEMTSSTTPHCQLH